MKIVHIINSLEIGGAESVLLALAKDLKQRDIEFEVVALIPGGSLLPEFQAAGITVHTLNMTSPLKALASFYRLAKYLRHYRPEVIQTWMYHANLIGGLANLVGPRAPLLWNIRQTNVDSKSIKRSTRLIVDLGRFLSRLLAQRIIVNSQAGANSHAAIGYDRALFDIIPNGIDTETYQPKTNRAASTGPITMILPARLDVQKDHKTFFDAARLVLAEQPKIRIKLCGGGIEADNPDLAPIMGDLANHPAIDLLGPLRNMAQVYGECDIGISSSIGEGFSNTVAEMMACGIPCVVTDVGDSRLIVGDHGLVVPARDPQALAQAMLDLIRMAQKERQTMGREARTRIVENYTLPQMTDRYLTLWHQLAIGSDNR